MKTVKVLSLPLKLIHNVVVFEKWHLPTRFHLPLYFIINTTSLELNTLKANIINIDVFVNEKSIEAYGNERKSFDGILIVIKE
ncbi:CLUMA_CG010233, isoform A [Clunio marinus]|uniref:CLUMA_CG010233, isoform A n=1 Tax=Clunio marinus TaxID=568069 RepID=A0A1J1I912_9DIPT|nr:CLUMA_CG010233, isoform A [Clunio marinus]